jgi:hypothetical protein
LWSRRSGVNPSKVDKQSTFPSSPRFPTGLPGMSSAAASALPTAVVKAPPQGGVLEGVNPVHFDAKNPIILFIVQVCIILVMARG